MKRILHRAERLWNMSSKFRPWLVQLDSGTIVIGLTTKSGRSKKLLGLVYITDKLEIIEELYVMYPEKAETSLRFARIHSKGDEHLFLTSPSTVLEEETITDMIDEVVGQIQDMDPAEILGEEILKLQAGWLEITEGNLNVGKIDEVELDILDPLKWTETKMQFLEHGQRLLEE